MYSDAVNLTSSETERERSFATPVVSSVSSSLGNRIKSIFTKGVSEITNDILPANEAYLSSMYGGDIFDDKTRLRNMLRSVGETMQSARSRQEFACLVHIPADLTQYADAIIQKLNDLGYFTKLIIHKDNYIFINWGTLSKKQDAGSKEG